MCLRLGFSIAFFSDPDILVLDENLSVGDENFKLKSKQSINEIISKGKTIILASHYMEVIDNYCDKVVWLDKGKIIKYGNSKIASDYVKNST